MKKTLDSFRKTIALIALLLSSLFIKAQNIKDGVIPDTPPSPQAVAFNRLGDYQVDNNYGMPDISIPLFEIDFHGYKIPLTLHYEASPIKSGYNYDVTGMGWTLSGNSCVSRTIKDRADEVVYYNYSSPFMLDPFSDKLGKPLPLKQYENEIDRMNYQYDSYNIVLPSGRTIPFFMYMWENKMKYDLLNLDSDVKIICHYTRHPSSIGVTSIDAFTVIDESGITYEFTLPEKATNGFDNDPNADRNVTWLLTSIDIPSKGVITYEYNEEQSINAYIVDEPGLRVSRFSAAIMEDWDIEPFEAWRTRQPQCPRYKMRFLKKICYGPTQVNFNYYSDKEHMKEIVITDNDNTIRTFTLGIDERRFASYLTSLVISGKDDNGKEDRLAYTFEYLNKAENLTDSTAIYTDYWGNLCYSNKNKDLGNFNMFFNIEEDGPVYLVKKNLRERLAVNNFVQLIDNKEDDPYYYYKIKLQSKPEGDTRKPTPPEFHGVLSRIVYPNGGRTDFKWENHRFPTATGADGDMVFDRRKQRIIEGGGFRIKSIINYTADGKMTNEEHYRYGFTLGDIIHRNFPLPLADTLNINDTINHHIGCGEAVVDPNVLTFMTFTYSFGWLQTGYFTYDPFRQFQLMVVGQKSQFKKMYDIHCSTWWDAYFSANTFRSLLGGRRPVVYPEITVYHGDPDKPDNCNSKTVYKYNIYSYGHDQQTYYLSTFNQTPKPDTAYIERIYYNAPTDAPRLICDDNQAAKRHQLKSKSDYSYNTASRTWNLVSEERYSYNEEKISEGGHIFNCHISRELRTNFAGEFGTKDWQKDLNLHEFYIVNSQCFGRSTLSNKSTTILRQGGTGSRYNTLDESYSYDHIGVLGVKRYSDMLKSEWSNTYDKEDVYIYVGDKDDDSGVISEMKSRNMLASLISTRTYNYESSTLLSGSKLDYAFYGDDILPSKLYESNGEKYEESLTVLSYDDYGNPTEIVDLKTGIHSVYLWDKDGRYMLAMINNTTLSQIGNTIDFLSANSQSRHSMLQSKFPQAQIQTWDYKPLIGVSSFTDINGVTILYEYDGLGRLISEKKVVNGIAEPEVLHKYEYNYKNK